MAGPSGDEEKSRDIISTTGYNNFYPDASSNLVITNLQNSGPTGPDIYNLSTGMENMIGFPSKSHDQNGPVLWKGFFTKPAAGPSSSPKDQINPADNEFHNYQHDFGTIKQHDLTELLVHDNDPSSLRSCVFTCEGNERPSHGLSLSLSSSNPSSIGLQSFELRQQQQERDELIRFGPSGSRPVTSIQRLHAYVSSSRYLSPAQELLSEICNLGTKQEEGNNSKMKAIQKNNEWQDGESTIRKQSLYSLELLELQRRKTKLLHMLEEVDRRYKHYCDQMKAVTLSFEYVAGNGSAMTYTALASKTMSIHFRRLKDAILSQIKETKKAMGEKDSAAPGTMKGETPRLRLLDQTLRQQRALQQMTNMEIHPWRPQRGLPERSVSVLRAWLFEHFLHPYPSDVDKHILARQTGLSRSQVSNWFINARVRLWKPMVEEMYMEELKEDQPPTEATFIIDENDDTRNDHDPSSSDQKPTHDQLVRIDSECLSSIINNPDKNDAARNKPHLQNHHHHPPQNPSFGRVSDAFGAMEFDFSSSYGNQSGGGVSLTLGLHQHGGGGGSGVNMGFSPASQSSFFYPRDQMEDCQTVPYSLLDGESQTLPYRNLMGAQLLHDLAG